MIYACRHCGAKHNHPISFCRICKRSSKDDPADIHATRQHEFYYKLYSDVETDVFNHLTGRSSS